MNSRYASLMTGVTVFLAGCVLAVSAVFAQQTAQPPAPAPAQQPTQEQAPAQPAAQAPVPAAPAAAPLPAATNMLAKQNPNETTLYNGVKIEVLRAAEGPKPAPNAIVQLQYIGHLEDGTEFDRSYSRRHVSIYKLSDVIGCWQSAIPEMNTGSKVRLTCPPGSANGKRPVDFIWGDTTLYFIVELIAIVG